MFFENIFLLNIHHHQEFNNKPYPIFSKTVFCIGYFKSSKTLHLTAITRIVDKSCGLIVPVFYLLNYLVMKNDVRELQRHFSPFGYLDLQRACEI